MFRMKVSQNQRTLSNQYFDRIVQTPAKSNQQHFESVRLILQFVSMFLYRRYITFTSAPFDGMYSVTCYFFA